MTPVEIRGAIMFITGMKPNDFAASKGIHQTTLHRVINNELQTARVRTAISEAVHLEISDLWPVEDDKEQAS